MIATTYFVYWEAGDNHYKQQFTIDGRPIGQPVSITSDEYNQIVNQDQ